MIIKNLRTTPVKIPLKKPITTAIHQIDSVGCLLIQLESNEGLVGESYVFTINATRLSVFNEMIIGLSHQIKGKNPFQVESIWNAIWKEINPTGHKGVSISALSGIDTACWDLIGKALSKPLHHLWGACRHEIKTYASSGLWLSSSLKELVKDAESFLKQGFKAMKIRIGNEKPQDDIERVKAVREAVGNEIELMVDANQIFSPKEAIKLGRKLEKFDLIWFEEPVAAYDLCGHNTVKTALDIPIATGETEYTRYGMKSIIEKKACDILMPDLQRAGGLSEFIKIAHLASAYHLPISSHIFTEHSLCLAGAMDNLISVEHIEWFATLFKEEIEMKDGKIIIPERAGCGFTFNPEAIKKYRID